MKKRYFDVRQNVRGNKNLDVLVRGDVPDEFEDIPSTVGIEIACGFVQEEKFGIMDESLGQLEPLFHPRGIGIEQPVAGFAESDIEKDLVGPFRGFGTRHSRKLSEVGRERIRRPARPRSSRPRACSRWIFGWMSGR